MMIRSVILLSLLIPGSLDVISMLALVPSAIYVATRLKVVDTDLSIISALLIGAPVLSSFEM